MVSLCLVFHELAVPADLTAPPAALRAWSLGKALSGEGRSLTLLHTGESSEGERISLAGAAEAAGLAYCHLDQLEPSDPRVFPAVAAHRLGLRVARALEALGCQAAVFGGHPAHASTAVAARRCASALANCPVVLLVDQVAERAREADQAFPADGRESIATDFLEKESILGADLVICASDGLRRWLGLAGWRVSGGGIEVAEGLEAAGRLADLLSAFRNAPKGLPHPTVSVCVAHYEHPRFLGRALASLEAQTEAAHEVIVIDDGSESAEARAVFAQAEARYGPRGWKFLRGANAGPAAARNRAAREATGEAVIFCDADNWFHPEMVAVFSRALAASGADCVTCSFAVVPDRPDSAEAELEYVYAPLGPCLELGVLENVIGDTNFIIRRAAFEALGGFQTASRGPSEDWEFLLRLLLEGRRLATVPAVLFNYRLTAGSHGRSLNEAANARAAVEPLFERLAPVWRRLWPHVAGMVRDPRVGRLEAELGATRAGHEVEAQAWSQRDRIRRASLFLQENSRAALENMLRASRDEAAGRRRHDAQVIEGLSRRSAELEDIRDRSSDKIRRMQESFSWRLTAPLRSLRRVILDPGKPEPGLAAVSAAPSAQGARFHWHMDAPRSWRQQTGAFVIRGWCFCEDSEPLQGIRARVGGRLYEGSYGLDRPDLLRAHSAWPQCAKSGFKVEAIVLTDDSGIILEALRADGQWRAFFDRRLNSPEAEPEPGSYEHWVRTYDTLTEERLQNLRASAAAMASPPSISVLMPVYNPEKEWLARAIESVRAQTYPHWELCIADDASTEPHVREILERECGEEPRIKVVFREKNGHICAATNTALEMAIGDWAALFDHDDELAPHALHCVAREIAAHPQAELIYSDEDKIDEQGTRFSPHFKPDWNPDLLLGQNYISHLAVYRTATLRALGGMRTGFEGSQDWDLALRVTERAEAAAIRHVPRILYHWRAGERSTALHLGEKDYAGESARRALAGHLERTGRAAQIFPAIGGHWRIAQPLPERHPLVSIIVPTHNAANLLRVCIASIIARTEYAPFEILLVNNRSDDPKALELFAEFAREDGVRVLDYGMPFNYSAINNFAARHARGEILCLLNNDVEVLGTGWLGELVSHAVRPEIGAVGARLYYPTMRLQHAGVITGIGGVAGHAFKNFPRDDPGTPQFRPHLAQNLSAITAACLAVRREVFFEAGGFDERRLPVAFNDVDFCLKVQALGYRNLYTPFAELLHHESASRGLEDTSEKVRRFQDEIAAMQERWGVQLFQDPAFNPNLSLDSEDFALAYPPRTPPLE